MYTKDDFYCDYQLYMNERFADESDSKEEIWDIIRSYPFGSRFRVYSATGKDVSDFITF